MLRYATMNLESGNFNLFPLFDFVARHPHMPTPKSPTQESYRRIIKQLLEEGDKLDCVPDKPGWYLWGKFNDIGWWETIYCGKSGRQKTSSLRTRLYDELREECVAFWASVYGKESAAKQARKINDQHNDGKYKESIPRALRKSGVHFVIWVSAEEASEKQIFIEEKILIDVYRPSFNAQRPGYVQRTRESDKIIRKIDVEIRKIKNA